MVTTRAFLTASSGIDLRGSTRGFWFAAIIFVVVMSGGVVGMAAADFDASESSVSATSPHVANGSDASTVTVLVNDTAGTPITGLTASNVSISLTGDAVVDDGFEETSEAGVYEFTVTNTEVETVTTTVTVDDSELGDQPETAFEPHRQRQSVVKSRIRRSKRVFQTSRLPPKTALGRTRLKRTTTATTPSSCPETTIHTR